MSKETVATSAPLHRVVGQLRKLLREGTPGRWAFHRDGDGDPWVMPEPRDDHGAVALPYNAHYEESDAQLIVAMHEATPALLAIAEAASVVSAQRNGPYLMADMEATLKAESDLRTALSLLPNTSLDRPQRPITETGCDRQTVEGEGKP